MAGSSLLALIDDIATLLDDIATMSKVATQKTASVLGDDLAVNAQQVSGVKANRELPVVWAVAKGSFVNKLILVPAALAISALIPWLIVPLLIAGGIYLCLEGFEKVWHFFVHKGRERKKSHPLQKENPDFESQRIRGAIRTDLILSAEIIVITLGVVSHQAFITQVGVLSAMAILITVGVYGLVAGIVRLDDAGLYLSRKPAAWQQRLGLGIVRLAPRLMKALSVLGTLAMFLVGGGILSHNIDAIHHFPTGLAAFAGSGLASAASLLFDLLLGLILGAVTLMVVTLSRSVCNRGASEQGESTKAGPED